MTHMFLVFLWMEHQKGESHDRKVITEIAPTLSQLLKIPFTNGTEAKVMTEILGK